MTVVLELDNSCPMQENSTGQFLLDLGNTPPELHGSPRWSSFCQSSFTWSFHGCQICTVAWRLSLLSLCHSLVIPQQFSCTCPLSWLLLFRGPELMQRWYSTDWNSGYGYEINIFIHTQNNWAAMCLWKADFFLTKTFFSVAVYAFMCGAHYNFRFSWDLKILWFWFRISQFVEKIFWFNSYFIRIDMSCEKWE